ncbi:MAG: hypothetical protein E6J90_19145 [Deltaproteobacteria bacterium]|nr:MAG: hypothetical protein E6J91_31620 [Deltaproteobacteria bacterium]TMQ18905.1 MAG: hypothetical protein E6J90_19145 [Deltaproteobacteria bacterium]
MTRTGHTLAILLSASLGVAACSDSIDTPPPDNTPPAGSTSGDSSTTFDHDNDGISIWDLLKRLTDQGPPSFTSQMHACMKVHYSTLGNVLASLGVNITNTTMNSAGQLYQSGGPAMSVANYPARVRESVTISTSQASREFDIMAAAAPEIIAAMPTLPRCQVGGSGPSLFDAGNQCQLAGISCLIGTPASQAHVDLCNQTITRASTPDVGKRLAVAVMLAAAYTCE